MEIEEKEWIRSMGDGGGREWLNKAPHRIIPNLIILNLIVTRQMMGNIALLSNREREQKGKKEEDEEERKHTHTHSQNVSGINKSKSKLRVETRMDLLRRHCLFPSSKENVLTECHMILED